MDGAEILGSVHEIYDRFLIPNNLRLHMYKVASVAEMVCDNLEGVRVNKVNVVAACLLHDLGNLVKFDLDSNLTAGLLGAEAKNIDRLKKIKAEMIAKYGGSDHEATRKMMAEVGVSSEVLAIINGMGYAFRDDYVPGSRNIETEICEYADCRVSPAGVKSIEERLADFCDRCKVSTSELMRKRGAVVARDMADCLISRKGSSKKRE